MVLVGLTGGIGSGKSSVAARLAARGAVVIDADAITRELQGPGQPVLAAMVARFGDAILAADGTLDRQAVADVVFADAAALADLNAIVHPAVGAEIARRLVAAEDAVDDGGAGAGQVVVLDVPLLVESGRGDLAGLVVVDVDPELAVARLVAQRGFSEADARSRLAHQASRADRLARADVVIDNSGDLDDLDREVDRVWAWIESLPGGSGPGEGVAPPR
ncbi:hypothetical protein BH20ACT2_BH20ACT2_24520 [soil metagenome]